MPSATHSESPALSPPGSKKRRWDGDGEVHMPFGGGSSSSTSHTGSSTTPLGQFQNRLSAVNNHERLIFASSSSSPSAYSPGRTAAATQLLNSSAPRKVIPLPVSKRFRLTDENENPSHHQQDPRGGGAGVGVGGGHDDGRRDVGVLSPGLHHHHHHNHHHHAQQQPSYFTHGHPSPTPPPPPPQAQAQARPGVGGRAGSSFLLSPCHICHRKPTKKSDLDSFGDCLGCGQRTCFVCLRACPGWLPPGGNAPAHGHGDGEHRGEEDDDVVEDEARGAGGEDDGGDGLSASFTMHDVDDEEHDDGGAGAGDRELQQQQHAPSSGPRNLHARQRQTKKDEGGGRSSSGWTGHGHRDVICSACCVERGSEGDVVCLGCLAWMEGA
ncbi:hypothetical protein GGR56DRAFT_219893 [Xylariaceae sp. FL0804]|nr:hypothetical protein GGR56DRAFT_219893 [Xylariaceae sp. FL0804]